MSAHGEDTKSAPGTMVLHVNLLLVPFVVVADELAEDENRNEDDRLTPHTLKCP